MSNPQNMSKNEKPLDIEEDVESVYDEEDVDVDVDEVEDAKQKNDDDDEEDEEDDDGPSPIQTSRRNHVYHSIPDSTEIKIVPADQRITSEYMTLYEYSMIIGTRATHISEGSVLYTDPQGLFDPRDIAKKEMDENKCPLSVKRQVSATMMEVWEVNEMIKPQM